MFSFGSGNLIDFDQSVIQLDGKNGAGKSSIPTILEELYYNKNSRGLKKSTILNRHCGQKTYSASSVFEKNGDTYVISKTVSSTTSLKLTKNGIDISGHTATQTYSILEGIIGLEFSTFSKLVYQSMVSSLDFLSATDANRKKFLVSLLGLEHYTAIQDTIKQELSDHKTVLAAYQSKSEYLITSIGKTVIPELMTEQVPPLVDESLFEKIGTLESEKAGLAKVASDIQANNLLKQKAATLKKSISTLEDSIKPMNLPIDSSDNLRSKFNSMNATRKAKADELARIQNAKTHCPTCGTAYSTDLTHRDSEISRLNNELAQLVKPMEELKYQYDYAKSFEEESKKLTELDKLKTDLVSTEERINADLPDTTPTSQELDSQISVLRKTLSDQKAERDKVLTHNIKVCANNSKAELAKETLAKQKTDLAEVSLLLDAAKGRNVILTVLNDAFSTKGIITYKIEAMVKVFESLINEYLEVLSDGRFALEFLVEDAKLALKLYDNSTEIEITQLSSGEFNRVNTATLLAVRRMMAAISKVNLNVLFLDEVVSVLDKSGKDTLIEVLLREQGLNSLVVSHGYNHPLAGKIRVIKENNISRLAHDE